jgi:hypothetical protein
MCSPFLSVYVCVSVLSFFLFFYTGMTQTVCTRKITIIDHDLYVDDVGWK